jgi:hypothetical protein
MTERIDSGRLLVIGDVHYSVVPPRARTREYAAHVRAKLAECAALARKLRATAACTGDFFHRKRATLEDVHDMIIMLRAMPQGFVYGIVGNHDAEDPARLESTGLGVLVRAGVVRLLRDVGVVALGEHAVLTGHDYMPETREVYLRATDAVAEVRLTHGMLVEGPPRALPFTATQAVELCGDPRMPTLLINGHYHHPFVHGGVVSVGSLVRTARDQVSPRRVLFVVARRTGVQWRSVPVRMAMPSDVVMRAEDATIDTALAKERARLDGAARAVAAAHVETTMDPEHVLEALSDEYGADAIDRARGYLRSAAESLGD